MEEMSQEYRELMEEKFKNVNETIDRNYKEQTEDRRRDTDMVIGKIGEVLSIVTDLKRDQNRLETKVDTLESETSWWRSIQGAIKKKPAISFSVVLGIWYILSLEPVKEFLFGFLK